MTSAGEAAERTHGDAEGAGDVRVREFLAETLSLWRVEGAVETGVAPVVAIVRLQEGATMWIERAGASEAPFRWWVRSRRRDDHSTDTRALRAKPCASIAGVLGAMRIAFGVDRGRAIRIAQASRVENHDAAESIRAQGAGA